VLLVINDKSALKRINILKETANYKDNLLATVSHDLRTPLNGIIGMISVAMQKIHDATVRKILSLSVRSSHLLLYMINDILDLSQISNKKLRLAYKNEDLWDLVNETVKLIRFQAKNKNLKLRLVKNISSEHLVISTDGNRVRQILLNLLSNALKFTDKGN
jgi:signal transduction histidine kinase